MKKFLLAVVLVASILLPPFVSDSFSANAGRTQQGFGAPCDCGLPAPPECYDEITLQRCDTGYVGGSNMAPDGGEGKSNETEAPPDYPSGVMLLLVAAFLTSRLIRFP